MIKNVFAEYNECTQHEFKCNNGQCVHLNKLCDSLFDCLDHSDEDGETCRG